jgi:hypothetical protein
MQAFFKGTKMYLPSWNSYGPFSGQITHRLSLIFPVPVLKKTRVTALAGDRKISLSRDTMVKKRASWGTAKEEIISNKNERILPIPVNIQDILPAVNILH